MSIISCVDVHDMYMYCTYLYAGTVTLIDYEYVGVNYPAFDIGSFFCEFGGNNPNVYVLLNYPCTVYQCLINLYTAVGTCGSVDYRRCPSESVQRTWIRYYLEECARIRGNQK